MIEMNNQEKQKNEELQFTKEELRRWLDIRKHGHGYIEIDAKITKNGKRKNYFMTGFKCKDENEFFALEKAIKEKAFAIQIGNICGHKHIFDKFLKQKFGVE